MSEEFNRLDGEKEVVFAEDWAGKSDEQWAKDYIQHYGEGDYVDFILEHELKLPEGITIKDPELQEKLKKAGLLS